MAATRRLLTVLLVTALTFSLSTVAAPPPTAVAAPAPTVLTLSISNSVIKPGETIWIWGTLTSSGKPLAGEQVVLQFRTPTGSWQHVSTATVQKGGSYGFAVRPTELGYYRTGYGGSAAYAPAQRGSTGYTWLNGRKTLERRAAEIGTTRLGRRTSDILSTTVNGAAVRYVTYVNGTLVEYGNASHMRTWWVTGEANRQYWLKSGPRGAFGVPILDQECYLLDNGCLQRFTGGSVYTSSAARQTGVWMGTGQQSELFAVAMSQVGYRAPASNISRYNQWIGTSYAWCSIFQSWVSAASGNGYVLPYGRRFSEFHQKALSWGRTTNSPSIGAIAFFDTHTYDGVSAATHAGLVLTYNSQYIWTIEGNTSAPDGSGGRGVWLKKRTRSHPMYYAHPTYAR